MDDHYQSFARSTLGRSFVRRLRLPDPPRLRRHTPGRPVLDGPVLLGAAPGGRAGKQVDALLAELGTPAQTPDYAALVFDATGIAEVTQLRALAGATFGGKLRCAAPAHAATLLSPWSRKVITFGAGPDEVHQPSGQGVGHLFGVIESPVGQRLCGPD